MKKIIILLTFSLFSCSSQNPITKVDNKSDITKVILPSVIPSSLIKESNPKSSASILPAADTTIPIVSSPIPTPSVINIVIPNNNTSNTVTNPGKSGSSSSGGGYSVSNPPQVKTWFNYTLVKDSSIVINQIIDSGTNKRVDDLGNSEIKPDYSGKEYNLTIKGKFSEEIIKEENIMFTNESDLLQMSYVGEALPKTKILIDDVIILEPISASTNEIKVKLNTEAISDFYLKGLHKFSIISDKLRTDSLIKIGEPEIPKVSLSPVIDEIKILKKKDIYFDSDASEFAFQTQNVYPEGLDEYTEETRIAIKIKGKNFPVFHQFTYSLIDSDFCYGHSTIISKDSEQNIIWESIIYISKPLEFEKNIDHSILYSTPFGSVFKGF